MMSHWSLTGLVVFALFATLATSQDAYNIDIGSNSRLLQSLGLASPDPIAITTSRSLYQSIAPTVSIQPVRRRLVPNVNRVTYLTVGDRPRNIRKQDRTATVLTVSDTRRPKKLQPVPPPPPSYSNEVLDDAKPYSFEYEATDEETGTRSARSERSDGRQVIGSYSYFDVDGVYRVVEYTADENGFRANVKTNEPGTSKSASVDPANTQWEIESPPEAVLAKYRKRY